MDLIYWDNKAFAFKIWKDKSKSEISQLNWKNYVGLFIVVSCHSIMKLTHQ